MRLRTLLLVAASLAALVGGLWYWRKSEETAARRLETWHEQERIDATAAALDRRYEWPAGEVSLAELAALIDKRSGLAVDLDRLAIESEGHKFDSYRFDIPGSTLSVASLLRLSVESHDLAYDVHDGRIAITTPDASRDLNRLRTVVYPLPQPEPSAARVPEERWYELITSIIEPDNWDEVGGKGHCKPVPGGLLIVHNEQVHRKIRPLIEAIRQLQTDPAAPFPRVLDPDGPRSELFVKLTEPTTIDCRAMPLGDLLTYLSQQHDIPIRADWETLRKAGFDRDWQITARLRSIPLQAALRMTLDTDQLTFVLAGDSVVVTTADEEESPLHMFTVAYPVNDLIAARGQNPSDVDSLVEVITTTIALENWVDVGGPGIIADEIAGWLLISQSLPVHQQIEQLLTDLRRDLLLAEQQPTLGSTVTGTLAKIEAALDRRIAVEFNGTPLTEVLDWIGGEIGVPILVEKHLFDDTNTKEHFRVPLSCQFAEATAREQLERLLEPANMVAVPDGEVLTVTSRWEADKSRFLTTRVYDARALGEWCEDEELQFALTSLIDVSSWNDVGGAATLRPFRGLFVVSQYDANHRSIQQFLQTLETECIAAQASRRDRLLLVGELPDADFKAALAKTVDVALSEQPLQAALRELAAENGLPLRFDERKLEEAGIDRKTPTTFAARGISLESALRLILEEHELAWNFRRNSYVVTSDDEHEQAMPTVAYRINDLVAQPSDREALRHAISDIVHPESWEEVGGRAMIKPLATWLLVGQTLEAHEKIERLLAELRSGIRQGNRQDQPLAADRPAENPKLLAALERPVDAALVETPLNEAIAEYSRQAQVPLVISAKRLEEAGVNLDTPVTLRTPAAPLADQLSLLLDAKELAFDLRHDLVEITTPESVDRVNRMPIRVYDVRPLVNPASAARLAVSPRNLVNSLIDRDSYDVGGPGVAVEYHGLLVVRNTRDVQQRVAQLLAALGKHVVTENPSAAVAERGIDIDPAREPLERLLERPIDVAITGRPLAQVLEELSTRHGFPLVNSPPLERTLIDQVRPITYVAAGRPLGTVLDEVLTPVRGAYTIRHGAVIVSDVGDCASAPSVRLYRADDLQQRLGLSLDELAVRVKEGTHELNPGAAGGWIDHGGTATLRELGSGWLAVAAPLRMQHRVADFLTEQRTGKVPDREMRWRALAPARAAASKYDPFAPDDPADNPFPAPPAEGKFDE